MDIPFPYVLMLRCILSTQNIKMRAFKAETKRKFRNYLRQFYFRMTKNHLSLTHIFQESRYDLVGVICHHGTAGGGHYTAYSLNNNDQEW